MSTDPLDHPWNRVRSELRAAVREHTWHLWLEGLRLREIAGDVLIVEVPDRRCAFVAERFGGLLRHCAGAALGPGVRVELVAAGEPSAPGPAAAARLGREAGFNPRLTFDQFVIGDANRLAHAAALSVAEMPGLAYNPLFICGSPGLGKTHLLQSIANYVRVYGGGVTVRYTTAEAFTNDFVACTRGGDMKAFKAAHRDVDVLLVDDVQFLQEKARTVEEFFHTFNAVHAAGAQIVLTSDRPPRDLAALEERLRARFESGLVTEIGRPDAGTRLTFLRKRVDQDEIAGVEPAALDVIAARVDDSVRALEGALIRVVAFASLTGQAITPELAGEVLTGLYPDLAPPQKRTVHEIQEKTCAAFGISMDDLCSPSRAGAVAWARQVAMYLSRELTDATLPTIGRAFGRNHTTVMHACKRTAERIAADQDAYEAVRRLTLELGR